MFDYFVYKVKNNVSNESNWLWDDNKIHNTINPHAINFHGKRVLEYLKGDYFLINLSYDKDSRFRIIHKFSTQGFDI